LIFPEDFPDERMPPDISPGQRLIRAEAYIPAQNAFGGIVYAGGTMAFTTGYWVLHSLRPRVLAFLGCDMVYPQTGPTHYYGTGTADPLRDDITLQDLGAKSARLALVAAAQGCMCVNLSSDPSELLFPRTQAHCLGDIELKTSFDIASSEPGMLERKLGYSVPSGRYWEEADRFDASALARIDAAWRRAWAASALAVTGNLAA
jgi:hypothetical protein